MLVSSRLRQPTLCRTHARAPRRDGRRRPSARVHAPPKGTRPLKLTSTSVHNTVYAPVSSSSGRTTRSSTRTAGRLWKRIDAQEVFAVKM
eukprot:168348-Pleurochrysis_carterae.AAC.2